MSMNKMFKKVLAVVAAGAMTMGMAMPTFAADPGKTTEAWITKTYNTEAGKAEKFSFTAEQVKTGTGIITTDAAVTMPEISFTDTETGKTSRRGKITFPTYPEAGKYEYTVKEIQTADPAVVNGDHEKMIMSGAEYTMDVYVTDGATGTEISNIVVNKVKDDAGQTETGKVDIGNTDTNTFNFTNTYVQEAGTGTNPTPDPDYTENGSLKISKNVIGNESSDTSFTASTSDEFNFTVNFVFPAGTDKNTLGGVKVDGTDVTINGDGDATLILKHNETKKFTGVPVGTKIIVTEAAKANYKGSAAVVINNEDKVAVVATKFNEEIKVLDEAANTGYKLGQNKNTVDVTNRYNNVPTTGIIMNTLPYVLMVALCAAALFGFVAFKRKKVQK